MDTAEIEKMAEEAGFVVVRDMPDQPYIHGQGQMDSNCGALLTRFAALVALAEREACALACEESFTFNPEDPAETYAAICRGRAS